MDVVLVDLLTNLIAEDMIGLRDMLASLQKLQPHDEIIIEHISPSSGEWPCLQCKQEAAKEIDDLHYVLHRHRKEIEVLESKLRFTNDERTRLAAKVTDASKTIDDLQRYTKQREEDVRKRVLRSNEGN